MKIAHCWLFIKRLKPEFWILLLAVIFVIAGCWQVNKAVKGQMKAQERHGHVDLGRIEVRPAEGLKTSSLKNGPVIFHGYFVPDKIIKMKCPECGHSLYWMDCFAVNEVPQIWAGYCLDCGYGWDRPDKSLEWLDKVNDGNIDKWIDGEE